METNIRTLSPTLLTSVEKVKATPRVQSPAPTPQVAVAEKSAPVAGNELGAAFHQRGPVLKPTLASIEKRYRARIIEGVDLKELRSSQKKIDLEREVQSSHSASVSEGNIRAASRRYAESPTVENSDVLRKLRTLQPADHSLAKQLSQQRVLAIFAAISPSLKKLHAQASASVMEEAQSLWNHEQQMHAVFEVAPVRSALVAGLFAIALDLSNQAKGAMFTGEPELMTVVLAATES